ncbi:U6 snRNA phosphodiesterase [Tripterygium wilfordii]|uniref:U6 snRNA phosphodiesterase n=1 Tax=Tripterygium wilfordii TaxID=458696 RepID=A0A7J7CA53_TRIWF|nr:U6 snRNA phosphodiesterase [Tripterygium wilfordii]KAF5731028.1 U6 snRNA phosphodiesterase [Tripterygium wilfordii]
MEALRASYGDAYSDSESEASSPSEALSANPNSSSNSTVNLPPPPLSLLTPPTSIGFAEDYLPKRSATRVRSFPHVEGNYSLHVYIPVYIPFTSKKEVALFLGKVSNHVPGLHLVDVDVPLALLGKDDQKLEQVALGREFHISLGRTVPIRVHQIDSMVALLRQKLQNQKRYWIDFSKWEVFVNDDQTRSFLSIEVVTGGLAEITNQIEAVDEVYKLHNLPEFYKNPRPHISLAWALGDVSDSLKRVVEDEIKRLHLKDSSRRRIFTCKFSGIECKIGNKTYKICKIPDEC